MRCGFRLCRHGCPCEISRLNNGQITRLFGRSDPFFALRAVFNCNLQLTEVASDVISRIFVQPIVPDTPAKFRHCCLNHCQEFRPKPEFSTAFRHNLWPEDGSDVVAVDYVLRDAPVKFGDSRSNGSQHVQRADFMSNGHDWGQSHKAFRLKTRTMHNKIINWEYQTHEFIFF